MSESGENINKGRRNFLKGVGAMVGLAAIGVSPLSAAETAEKQENKIPSVEEIDKMTRDTIANTEKAGLSFWGENRSDELRVRVFGGGNLVAGMRAFWDREKDNGIKNILIDFKSQAEAFSQKEILKIVDAQIAEATALHATAERAYGEFLRESGNYFELVQNTLRDKNAAEQQAANLRTLKSLAPAGIQIPDTEVQISGKDTMAKAEELRQNALVLARANDQLLELQAKYLGARQK